MKLFGNCKSAIFWLKIKGDVIKMSKKTAKLAGTYIITILLTLLIVGGFVIYMFESMLTEGDKKDETEETAPGLEQLVASGDYAPTAADNRTLLVMLETEKRESASAFLIVRFLPVDKQIVLMPVPSNTLAQVDGGTDTVYNYFRNGGSAAAINAVTACTGVEIDKYLRLTKDSFGTVVDIFGGVDFDVPYPLIYSNTATGEETAIREGRNYLDSELLRKVLTYPNYKSGEEYRAKCLAVTTADMLNGNLGETFATHLDDYFNLVMNSDVETDITAYDYKEISEAMKYLCRNSYGPASFVLSTGVTDENGTYTLDDVFLNSIPQWLKTVEEKDPYLE